MKMNRLIKASLLLLFPLLAFTACEKPSIDFSEENKLVHLEAFHGMSIKSVKKQLSREGFMDLSFGTATQFAKKDEQYLFMHNTADKHTINSAMYMRSFEKNNLVTAKFDEWKTLIKKNEEMGNKYIGTISATNFTDLEKNYIDSVAVNDTTWNYIYDNEGFMQFALEMNKTKVTFLNETWYNGEKNTGKELAVQYSLYTPQPGSTNVGNAAIINSDFGIK